MSSSSSGTSTATSPEAQYMALQQLDTTAAQQFLAAYRSGDEQTANNIYENTEHDSSETQQTTGSSSFTSGSSGSSSTTSSSSPVKKDPSVDDSTKSWQSNDPNAAATTAWQNKNNGTTGSGYQQYTTDLKNGDGNAMVRDIHNALNDGTITQAQATTLYNSAEDDARRNGGGNLSGDAKKTMCTDLAKGATSKWAASQDPSAQASYQKFLTDAGNRDGNAMVKDIHDAEQKGLISKSDAATAYTQAANIGGKLDGDAQKTAGFGTVNAYAAQWGSTPAGKQSFEQFSADYKKGDGNAMVQDVHSALQSGAITNQQAQNLYSQCEGLAREHGGGNLSGSAQSTIKEDSSSLSSYSHYQADLAKGDGNAMVSDITSALNNHLISQDEATALMANAQPAAAKNGGGNLSNSAKSMMSSTTSTDVATQWQQANPQTFQKFLVDIKNGDGNSMCQDIHDALQSGDISKAQATTLYMAVPATANQNGGGKCNDAMTKQAQDDTGDSRILNGGMSQSLYKFENTALALFCSPAYAAMKQQNANAPNLANNLAGVQQNGSTSAAQDFAKADPAQWSKFTQAMQSGDGNTAAQALLAMKGKISDADIGSIAGQMQGDINSGSATTLNDNQGGKVGGQISNDIRDQFKQSLGVNYDVFSTGQSVASINADKAGQAILGMFSTGSNVGVALTDSVDGNKDAVAGDWKDAGIGLAGSSLDFIPGAGEALGAGLSTGLRTGLDIGTDAGKEGASQGLYSA